MPDFTLRIRNFRTLELFEWSPQGVCLLAGSNGAGKTTVLDGLLFLRVLFERGPEAAFQLAGARYFRSVTHPTDEPVLFELQVGEVLWRLRFPMEKGGLKDHFGEEILHGAETVVRAAMFENKWTLGEERLPLDDVRCCAKVYWERTQEAWMKPLVDLLSSLSVHKSYALHRVRQPSPDEARKHFLYWSGQNLWAVLGNWKSSAIRSEGRFDWVITEARKAFPGLLATLEFEDGAPMIYPRGAATAEQGLPPERMADGLLTGLLHLTAVAGARRGAVLAFDEVENQLHPHAIRSLLASMRDRAEANDLTIVVTTHSPVVMNEFRDDLERVFVLDRSDPTRSIPIPLSDLHNEDWLAQSKLGTLYERLAFAAPIPDPRP